MSDTNLASVYKILNRIHYVIHQKVHCKKVVIEQPMCWDSKINVMKKAETVKTKEDNLLF